MAESRRKPIMNEVHAPEVQSRGAFRTQTNRPFTKKDNVDEIIDSCVDNFSKFRTTLVYTENEKILRAAENTLLSQRGTKLSEEEKKILLEIIANKDKKNKFL